MQPRRGHLRRVADDDIDEQPVALGFGRKCLAAASLVPRAETACMRRSPGNHDVDHFRARERLRLVDKPPDRARGVRCTSPADAMPLRGEYALSDAT